MLLPFITPPETITCNKYSPAPHSANHVIVRPNRSSAHAITAPNRWIVRNDGRLRASFAQDFFGGKLPSVRHAGWIQFCGELVYSCPSCSTATAPDCDQDGLSLRATHVNSKSLRGTGKQLFHP